MLVELHPGSHGCSIIRRSDVHITFPSRHEPFRLRARPHEQTGKPAGGTHPQDKQCETVALRIRHIRRQPATDSHPEKKFRRKATSGNVFGLVGC
ncbi:conserved protein of unknown function [Streptomyces sp. KY75]|nr:conserved protein of unknown function [Streptomyces sp. KY70]CAD5987806.1 conserved protein of unknown function [Streptomyces sp. KY75]